MGAFLFTCFRGQAPDQGTARDLDEKILSRVAIHAFAETGVAVLGDEARLIILGDQVVQVVIRLEDDIAAAPAVAAAWPAFGPILLALERDASLPAVPGASVNLYFIDEHAKQKARP